MLPTFASSLFETSWPRNVSTRIARYNLTPRPLPDNKKKNAKRKPHASPSTTRHCAELEGVHRTTFPQIPLSDPCVGTIALLHVERIFTLPTTDRPQFWTLRFSLDS